MDTRPPGDELDPQAAPRPDAPEVPQYQHSGPPPQPQWQQPAWQPAPQAVMVPIPGAVATEHALLIPAGFGPRFLAFLIDMATLGIIVQIFKLLIGYHDPDPDQMLNAMRHALRSGGTDWSNLKAYSSPGWLTFLQYCIYATYYTVFHAYNGATLGKMALGLTVRQRDGRPLTLLMAAARWVGYWLTGWLLYTAWMIGLDREKRTAYDALLKLNVFKVVAKQ
jgi:uncharacterized RDD family membrane protein YckC